MTPHLEITAVTSKNTDTLESIFKQLCNKYLQKKKRSSNGFFFYHNLNSIECYYIS